MPNRMRRSWLRGVGAAILLLLCALCSRPTQAQDLPELPRLLDTLETAIGSIKTFDVHVQVKTEVYFSTPAEEGNPQKVRLEVFPEPKVFWSRSHQLFANNGWRRIEGVDRDTGKDGGSIAGADNEVERIFFPHRREGIIRVAGMPAIETGMDYQETFRTVVTSIPIMTIFRERIKDVRVRREKDGRIVLEVDPTTKRGITYGGWGFRVYADPAVNMLPAVTEKYDIIRGERVLLARRTIVERKKVAPGVEVPVKSVTDYFEHMKEFGKFQQVWQKATLTVDVARSRWNQPISDDAFLVPFPAGTRITDTIRDVAYVTGKPDPGRNLADLAANARGLITNIRPVPPKSSAWLWWSAAGGGAAVFALAAFYLYRRRLSGRAL